MTMTLAYSDILRALAIATLALMLVGQIATAEDSGGDGSVIDPVTETWIPSSSDENPSGQIDYGAHLRVRYVYTDNVLDLGLGSDPDPLRRFFRIRSRLWLRYRFSPTTSAYVRLNNESRAYLECESCDSEFDEIIFENFYIEADRPFGLPLGVRLGRQDLFYGEGFIICDGGPLDGSRTGYVNGVLVSASVPLWDLDAFAVWNRDRDEYLPRINNKYTDLIEHDEFLTGLMLRRRVSGERSFNYSFEPYYVFKEESDTTGTSRIHTAGARVGFPVMMTRISAEFAYQGGTPAQIVIPEMSAVQRPDTMITQTISAFGGKLTALLDLQWPVPWTLTGGYIYLSGDEPKTLGKFEAWNPVLGRWPIWSDLYIYTLFLEKDAQAMQQGIAYWQNFESSWIGFEMRPTPNLKAEGRYMWLGADESVFYNPKLSGHTRRGDLYIGKLSWDFTNILGGHLLVERFVPGDFYLTRASNATFIRLELSRAF
jgi:hypothetical protein